ncbi:MAG: LUD domain-containing protein, partial [Chloroflexi bacterium]|nr:LUD domain-containing protein [Chloroflexota bacterium]
MEAAHNKSQRMAMSRAIFAYRQNVSSTLEKFPHTVKMAEEVREIKKNAISNMDKLAGIACEAIESHHGRAYIARTSEEALKIIGDLVGKGKLIVKGKSMTGEEIGLREYLEARDNKVYETDLGEFIIQKLNSRPMHILAPAVHVPKEDVAKLFSSIIGEKLPPEDIPRLVAVARELLREKFFKADIGMSSANVVAAETGSLFIIENEGNVNLCTGVPPVHIALVG